MSEQVISAGETEPNNPLLVQVMQELRQVKGLPEIHGSHSQAISDILTNCAIQIGALVLRTFPDTPPEAIIRIGYSLAKGDKERLDENDRALFQDVEDHPKADTLSVVKQMQASREQAFVSLALELSADPAQQLSDEEESLLLVPNFEQAQLWYASCVGEAGAGIWNILVGEKDRVSRDEFITQAQKAQLVADYDTISYIIFKFAQTQIFQDTYPTIRAKAYWCEGMDIADLKRKMQELSINTPPGRQKQFIYIVNIGQSPSLVHAAVLESSKQEGITLKDALISTDKTIKSPQAYWRLAVGAGLTGVLMEIEQEIK